MDTIASPALKNKIFGRVARSPTAARIWSVFDRDLCR